MRFLFATLTSLAIPWFIAGTAIAGGSVGEGIPPPYRLPEPASLAVLGAGVGALMIIRRLRK